MRLIFLFLFGCLALQAQEFAPRVVRNMAELRLLAPVPSKPLVQVLGYYNQWDGGGATYVLTNSIVGTNAYGGKVLTLAGTNSWQVADEPSTHIRNFGAKGDGVTDDTVAIQAWVDWTESGTLNGLPYNRSSAAIPRGQYVIGTVFAKSAVFRTDARAIDFQFYRNVSFLHKVGATNDMFICDIPAGLGDRTACIFEGIDFIGQREQNLKNPKPVVSSASRTSFFVDVANLPPNPFTAGLANFTSVGNVVTGSDWPYNGFCFFFTSEDRYMGGGLVESYNYTTGEVILKTGFDWYETISTASGLLTSDAQVCFSTWSTEDTFIIPDATLMDGTTAGYSAINWRSIYGQLGSGFTVRNCTIQNFHTGLRLGSCTFPQVHDNTFRYCTYSGIAGWSGGYLRDTDMRNYFNFGGYRANYPNLTAETIVLSLGGNNSFRNSMWGYYGFDSSGMTAGTLLINYTTCGIFARSCFETHVSEMMLDGITMHPMVVIGGGSGSVFMSIGSLIIREAQGTLPTYIGHNRVGIYSYGQNVALNISRLSFSQFSGGPSTNRLDYGFRTGTSDIFAIGSLIRTNGFATFLDPASSHSPVIDNYLGYPGAKISGGSTLAHWGRTDLDAKVELALGSGRPLYNTTLGQMVLTDNVTPLTSRNTRFGSLSYDTTEEPVMAVNMQNGSANAILNLGGGSGVYNAATQVGIYLAPGLNQLTGSELYRFETNRLWAYNGDISFNKLGHSLRIKVGDNGKFTTAVLSGGTVTVTNTSWLVTTAVFPVHLTHSGTPGALSMGTVASSGTVRTFNSTSGTDNGTIALVGFDQQP
jgi:hypothetical protein